MKKNGESAPQLLNLDSREDAERFAKESVHGMLGDGYTVQDAIAEMKAGKFRGTMVEHELQFIERILAVR